MMRLLITGSSGVCDGMLGMLRQTPQVFNWSSSKSSFDTFITVTCVVDWLMEYKCRYRGETFCCWGWLCKIYLHNRVFGSEFPGSDKMHKNISGCCFLSLFRSIRMWSKVLHWVKCICEFCLWKQLTLCFLYTMTYRSHLYKAIFIK